MGYGVTALTGTFTLAWYLDNMYLGDNIIRCLDSTIGGCVDRLVSCCGGEEREEEEEEEGDLKAQVKEPQKKVSKLEAAASATSKAGLSILPQVRRSDPTCSDRPRSCPALIPGRSCSDQSRRILGQALSKG